MSEIDKSLLQDLLDAVHGDLRAYSRLQRRSPKEIQQAQNSLGELVVTPRDVCKVLVGLLEHKTSLEQAQSWAFFIRRGYIGYWKRLPISHKMRRDFERVGSRLLARHQAVPVENGPIEAIDIDYDSSAEDEIADVLARLDDIGMEIDGPLTDEEITVLLHKLEGVSGEGL
jgi:hypothetical protein